MTPTAPTVAADSRAASRPSAGNARFLVWNDRGAQGRRYGFIDARGILRIPCELADAYEFQSGVARVRDHGRWKFINEQGTVVCELSPGVPFCGDFSEGMAFANLGGRFNVDTVVGGKWGFINIRGKFIAPPRFAGYDFPVRSFREGLAAVKIDGKWGFVDQHSQAVIPARYDDVAGFSDNRAAVRLGKWGFISSGGEMVVPAKYDDVQSFSAGFAAVRSGDHAAFIDKSGAERFSVADWDDWSQFSEGLAAVRLAAAGPVPPDARCDECSGLIGGFLYGDACPHCGKRITGTRACYIDEAGKPQIETPFAELRPFADGLAAVKTAGPSARWGFIDRKGKLVIAPKFHDVRGGFRDGLCQVSMKKDQEEQYDTYIDRSGRIVWQAPAN